MSAMVAVDWRTDFVTRFLPVVRRHVGSVFRRFSSNDREEATQGAIALAFVAYADLVDKGKSDQAYPSALATFATRQVQAGRIVGGSMSSNDVMSRTARKKRGFTVARITDCPDQWREQLGQHDRSSVLDQVSFRLDYPCWLSRLSPRERMIAEALAAGERAKDVARRFGVAPSRITQIRQELHASWNKFHGEPVPE